MRSADCVNLKMSLALQALWKGLMYDASTLNEALALAPRLSREDAQSLRETVARDGLSARQARVDVLSLAKESVRLAVAGLERIAPGEVKYLEILQEQVLEDEVSPADILLNNWRGSWHGSMNRVVEYLRIA
jgi:glutamate--cysteine ligase